MTKFKFSDELSFLPKKEVDCNFNHTWNYEMPTEGNVSYGSQREWNQTLITKVNQISAQIHKSTFRGGANKIKLHPVLGLLIQDMEFYHCNFGSNDILAGRYEIIYDSTMPRDEIIVYSDVDSNPNNCSDNSSIKYFVLTDVEYNSIVHDIVHKPRALGPSTVFENQPSEMEEISVKVYDCSDLTQEQINKILGNRMGKIKILNYE